MEGSTDPGKMVHVGHEESVDEQAMIHSLLQSVIAGLIGVVSITGNMIAFVTLVNNRRVIRTPIYIVIGGLALTDILNTALNVPEEIINKAEKGDLKSELWCKIFGYLFNSVQYITPFHIVVLAVFRGILLTARDHHGPTSKIAFLTCIILWIVSLLANIPMINHSKLTIQSTCAASFDGAENPGFNFGKSEPVVQRTEELYILLSAAFSYFLPLVLIFVIYLVTGYMSQRYFEDSYSPRERRLSKMITYIIYVFALCRLPDEMVTLLVHFQLKNTDFVIALSTDINKLTVWFRVREYLSILAMLDCALRPVIYATMSQEFGAVYDSIINCRYCKKEDDDDLDPQPLRRRRQEIEEVIQSANHGPSEVETPLRPSIEVQDYDAERDIG
ncbi:galanin receptor type 1-like [Dreissena polymorpha]|uniref:G-protein coupled receptors family 1 profile domain-containing protein n=1 Tax=Dreissena polymorpha TaxID=45954 RepID=A0A9D4KJG7_DREPO|nr:galanin receptor type 1-like [Dreissena polymorpha]XP_052280696.1 galanin receptor type 1-like [Dreissena polymorpha]XP_052280697.1 galanin receptor type 1-like [Dreissena polymorpha]XP_052280698.1 galanin receptor type 1-like [Dreissena polymorpha]KAH3840983.1 hypothetical protein DPMN_114441 [Dreissena polymorpha]